MKCVHSPAAAQVRATLPSPSSVAQLCIPEFDIIDPLWIGSSYIVMEFPLEINAGWISFASLVSYATTDFVLAVRTKNRRFKFWQNVGENFQADCLYEGEPIYADAVFEIWTTLSSTAKTIDEFCLPIQRISDCPSVSTKLIVSVYDQLWAKFCVVPVTGVETGTNYVQFYFSKPI